MTGCSFDGAVLRASTVRQRIVLLQHRDGLSHLEVQGILAFKQQEQFGIVHLQGGGDVSGDICICILTFILI